MKGVARLSIPGVGDEHSAAVDVGDPARRSRFPADLHVKGAHGVGRVGDAGTFGAGGMVVVDSAGIASAVFADSVDRVVADDLRFRVVGRGDGYDQPLPVYRVKEVTTMACPSGLKAQDPEAGSGLRPATGFQYAGAQQCAVKGFAVEPDRLQGLIAVGIGVVDQLDVSGHFGNAAAARFQIAGAVNDGVEAGQIVSERSCRWDFA